jgi:3-methyl-2-oxobutanoate hydroxymethyltransferase
VTERVSLPELGRMKATGRKIVGVVAWDYQLARIVDRVGVEIVSVGDTVGVNLWGHASPLQVTLEEMILVGRAVRRAVTRALVSCDFPYGPLQEGTGSAVRAAVRLVKEAGADLVKLDGAADYPEAVRAITRAGIPVFAQLGLTPQTALRHGAGYAPDRPAGEAVPEALTAQLVEQARRLESAGAVLLNFTGSGPVAGPAVVAAVRVPVLGGFGGGPWLDGRIRMATAAIGYPAAALDAPPPAAYANVARTAYQAIGEYAADVRAGRQIGRPLPPLPAPPPAPAAGEGEREACPKR